MTTCAVPLCQEYDDYCVNRASIAVGACIGSLGAAGTGIFAAVIGLGAAAACSGATDNFLADYPDGCCTGGYENFEFECGPFPV